MYHIVDSTIDISSFSQKTNDSVKKEKLRSKTSFVKEKNKECINECIDDIFVQTIKNGKIDINKLMIILKEISNINNILIRKLTRTILDFILTYVIDKT